MKLLHGLQDSFSKYPKRNAFRIGNQYYTYEVLAQVVSNIRNAIKKVATKEEKHIGLIANDDIETYAAILACWFEGRAYVPMNPTMPEDRNLSVVEQAEIKTIIDSSGKVLFSSFKNIESATLENVPIDIVPIEVPSETLAYIFFTSGTTGVPKGVPITHANLTGFIDAFWEMGYYEMTEEDRCLQMFELTFDLSVMSYLAPLLKGACVYTIPKDKVKYSYIFELMDEHDLTVTLMVPSILHYLRPYFEEIDCPKMRYSMFCGEALPLDITKEWSKCIPNARVVNVYGPTEDTIFCTDYEYQRDKPNKEYNGVLCIGSSMKGTDTILVDKDNNILGPGEKGELCLGGVQLTPGYWKNDKKNKEAFFYIDYKGEKTRFYRTGDLCSLDEDGDIMYLGRIDFQTKIQGFRVELSEIEFRAKEVLDKTNAVAVAFNNKMHNAEIGLVIEGQACDTTELLEHMSSKLPNYMLPSQVKFVKPFPLNTNGKTDRKKLKKIFEEV